jgi:hypothetical protein
MHNLYIYIAVFLSNSVITALVTNLPAPTKDSTAKYTYWFKVANAFCGAWKRASDSAIEDSPNWADAVDAHVKELVANGVLVPGPAAKK